MTQTNQNAREEYERKKLWKMSIIGGIAAATLAASQYACFAENYRACNRIVRNIQQSQTIAYTVQPKDSWKHIFDKTVKIDSSDAAACDELNPEMVNNLTRNSWAQRIGLENTLTRSVSRWRAGIPAKWTINMVGYALPPAGSTLRVPITEGQYTPTPIFHVENQF